MTRSPSATPRQSSTNRPLRTAVVGAGRIAEQHLAFAAASPLAMVVGVCDASRTLARHMTERFGGEPFTVLPELLERTSPDVVHVLTPARFHVDMAMACLAAGAHVVVEKPMAVDRAGREALLDRADSAGLVLVEDHNYRFNRPMLAVADAAATGRLGRLVRLEVAVTMPLEGGNRYADRNLPSPSHALPAGFIHEFITHIAYLATALVPELRVEAARWRKRIEDHDSKYDEFEATVVDADVVGSLRFSALGPRPAITVRLSGTRGHAEAELLFGSCRIDRPRRVGTQLSPPVDALVAGAGTARRGIGYVTDRLRGRSAYEGLHELMHRTYDSVLTGRQPPLSRRDMQRAGDLVDELVGTMP